MNDMTIYPNVASPTPIKHESHIQFDKIVRELTYAQTQGLITKVIVDRRFMYQANIPNPTPQPAEHRWRADRKFVLEAAYYENEYDLEYDAVVSFTFSLAVQGNDLIERVQKLYRYISEQYPELYVDVSPEQMKIYRIIAKYEVK